MIDCLFTTVYATFACWWYEMINVSIDGEGPAAALTHSPAPGRCPPQRWGPPSQHLTPPAPPDDPPLHIRHPPLFSHNTDAWCRLGGGKIEEVACRAGGEGPCLIPCPCKTARHVQHEQREQLGGWSDKMKKHRPIGGVQSMQTCKRWRISSVAKDRVNQRF
jgi:hypothetical protein